MFFASSNPASFFLTILLLPIIFQNLLVPIRKSRKCLVRTSSCQKILLKTLEKYFPKVANVPNDLLFKTLYLMVEFMFDFL